MTTLWRVMRVALSVLASHKSPFWPRFTHEEPETREVIRVRRGRARGRPAHVRLRGAGDGPTPGRGHAPPLLLEGGSWGIQPSGEGLA